MGYTKEEMLDKIEGAVTEVPAGQFKDVDSALTVLASSVNYLFSQCEGAYVKDGPESKDTNSVSS